MGKTIDLGMAKKDDPLFTGGCELFSRPEPRPPPAVDPAPAPERAPAADKPRRPKRRAPAAGKG
jgi:hypothetical protein